jgi:hypothetical protein
VISRISAWSLNMANLTISVARISMLSPMVIDHDGFGDSGMVPAGFGVERTQEHVITEVAL